MKDRYERPRGHSFGATHSGVTNENRPILSLLLDEWEDYGNMVARIGIATHRSPSSISGCIRGLRRHGLIDWIEPRVGEQARLKRSASGAAACAG